MELETLELTIADGIATVTLNRPPHNAQNAQMRGELIQVFDSFNDNDDVKCAIVTGKGKILNVASL